jgi:phenylacetic acid degradation protein paaN
MSNFTELFEKHRQTLEEALRANQTREFYAHWPEAPSGKIYGENANDDGKASFENRFDKNFELPNQKGSTEYAGEEESPYGFKLGVKYPVFKTETLIENAQTALKSWRKFSAEERAGILIECLERASKRFFEIGYATMHTTGQGFVMSFQASGPHSFDRALEAIATGYSALTSFKSGTTWVKPMGKMSVTLEKNFYAVPKGIGVVIGCSTFPIWNNVPGMFADLITGNVTIAKAHPKAVLPMAILIADMQNTLADLGVDPHIVQLAADTTSAPQTLELVNHPAVKIIDYTGSSAFGKKLEEVAAKSGKLIFTEKAGVNCVILDSAINLDSVLDNLAFSISLYSGQMCTAPQNIFIPKEGVIEGENLVSFDEVADRFKKKIDGLVNNEKVGPSTLGALQNKSTQSRVDEALKLGLDVIRPSECIAQAGFDNACTASPLVLKADFEKAEIYQNEWFGPICFLIPVDSFESAVKHVAESVQEHGALSTAVYTTDFRKQKMAEEELVFAGAPVAFNFTGPIWVNQSAAFSDFHGTGANPAGNASFADLSFITQRYNVIGSRALAPVTA